MKVSLFDIENWKEIGSTLARNKTRTFLTGFGIFWGVTMLALLMGGARGAEDMLRRNFQGFATNSAFMSPGWTSEPYKGHAKGREWEFRARDLEILRQAFPELSTVTPFLGGRSVSYRNGKYSYSSNIMGVEPEFVNMMEPVIYEGRFINSTDIIHERKVAVIGKKLAAEIFPNESSAVGKMVEINGISYTVVGIAGQNNEMRLNGSLIDEQGILPASTYRRAYNVGDNVGALLIVGERGANLTELAPKIRQTLYRLHDVSPTDEGAMWFMNVSEEFSKVDTMFVGLSLLALFIGMSTLLAGVIGIGNIMWVIVKERTREIGIRRAIGAKPRDIIAQILSEGVALTAVAGIAGISFATIVLAVAQSLTADEISTPRFQMNLGQALAIFVTFAVLGTLAGLIPAIKAMRIKPVEAMNDK
ncbi:MAG: ABC transporter permease [[Clostridium] fimetarium]|nr:ABC transporter permease [Alistipes timonensis]MCM1405504.1 ABC transporter permease [[Clostridium] fimetarium]